MLNVTLLNSCVRTTNIKYRLSEPSRVILGIYDVQGRLVRCLAKGIYDPGHYIVTWDGKDDMNKKVNNGVYFVQLETKDYKLLKTIRFK